jgi:hypothetical protein
MPFGFHLTVDTLPSLVIPRTTRANQLLKFWICCLSLRLQRDFNPPEQSTAQHTLWLAPTSQPRFIAAFDLPIFAARCRPPSCSAGGWDLPVPIPEASTHAEGLRPRRYPATLATSSCGLLPSASPNSVGSTGLSISWLHTSPSVFPCQRFVAHLTACVA